LSLLLIVTVTRVITIIVIAIIIIKVIMFYYYYYYYHYYHHREYYYTGKTKAIDEVGDDDMDYTFDLAPRPYSQGDEELPLFPKSMWWVITLVISCMWWLQGLCNKHNEVMPLSAHRIIGYPKPDLSVMLSMSLKHDKGVRRWDVYSAFALSQAQTQHSVLIPHGAFYNSYHGRENAT